MEKELKITEEPERKENSFNFLHADKLRKVRKEIEQDRASKLLAELVETIKNELFSYADNDSRMTSYTGCFYIHSPAIVLPIVGPVIKELNSLEYFTEVRERKGAYWLVVQLYPGGIEQFSYTYPGKLTETTDIHRQTSSELFSVPYEDVSEDQRKC